MTATTTALTLSFLGLLAGCTAVGMTMRRYWREAGKPASRWRLALRLGGGAVLVAMLALQVSLFGPERGAAWFLLLLGPACLLATFRLGLGSIRWPSLAGSLVVLTVAALGAFWIVPGGGA